MLPRKGQRQHQQKHGVSQGITKFLFLDPIQSFFGHFVKFLVIFLCCKLFRLIDFILNEFFFYFRAKGNCFAFLSVFLCVKSNGSFPSVTFCTFESETIFHLICSQLYVLKTFVLLISRRIVAQPILLPFVHEKHTPVTETSNSKR
jgi:hypothetical protein